MRTPRLLIEDIRDSLTEILDTAPSTVIEFHADKLVQSHILRHIAIIGEAASRLPKPVREAHPLVPWRSMIDMRNIVVHVYHGINWNRVYETARNDIPILKSQIQAILDSLPPDPTA